MDLSCLRPQPDLVYFRSQHPEGIAFAIALAGNPEKWTQGNGLDFISLTSEKWPEPESCKGRHVILEHYIPPRHYLADLASKALSVTLWADKQLSYGVPASNVTVHCPQMEGVPSFVRLDNSPWTANLHRKMEQHPLWLWLWAVANENQQGFLAPTRSFLDKFKEAYGKIQSGLAYTEGEICQRMYTAHLEDQLSYTASIKLAGIQGFSLNLPYHLLRYACGILPADLELLLVFSVRRGTVVGFLRVPHPMRNKIAEQLREEFNITLSDTPTAEGSYVLKTSLSRLSRLITAGKN